LTWKTALFAVAMLMAGTTVAAADPRGSHPPPPPAYGAHYPQAHGAGWGHTHSEYRDDDRWRDHRGHRGHSHDRHIRRGDHLSPWQFHNAVYVGDFVHWRLRHPPRGAAWMRLGDRMLLVRQADGLVLDMFRV
jgi:Ni/Co efflux regulator RcnB